MTKLSIADNVSIYKTKRPLYLENQQKAYIPMVEDDQIEYLAHSYLIDGKRTLLIKQGDQCCFKLRYLKFKPMSPRKANKYRSGIWPMNTLVDENVIRPFMLFINGQFIPWDLMFVSISVENNFLLVDSALGTNPNFKILCSNVEYAKIILLPDRCKCITKNPSSYRGHLLFSFDENGLIGGKSYYIIDLSLNAHIISKFWTADKTKGVNALKILDDNTSIKLTDKNVILFVNGRLTIGSMENIKKAQDGNYKDEETGRVTPCLEFVTSDYSLPIVPGIRFDSSLLTINNGVVPDGDTYTFGVFINVDYTPNADNISLVDTDVLSDGIKKKNSGSTTPSYLNELQEGFDFTFDRNLSYSTNLANAIKKMYSYNPYLFDEVIASSSNLVVEEYDGEWVAANTNEAGCLVLPRQHSSMIDEFFIIFVNGELYQYYHMGKYKANAYILPIQGINRSDIFEILRFQNVNNSESDLTIAGSDIYKKYSDEIINSNMILYTSDIHDKSVFKYPSDGHQSFPVEYELDYKSDGSISINLEDSYYYSKPLKVVQGNRFKYFSFVLKGSEDVYKINLADKFMYCHDYARYMVFYNGRRLAANQYRLALPVRSGTPFSEYNLYLPISANDGDRVDVFYLPSLMKDVVFTKTAQTSGDIHIDKDLLTYGTSRNLYILWVNGKKIPASHIADLNSVYMKIIEDEGSVNNLCITKYIPDIATLSEAYKNNPSIWDAIIGQLSDEEACNLLGIQSTGITSTESNFHEDAVNIRTIMYELIREEFAMNPGVDPTKPFTYDYMDIDTSIVDTYDSGGNIILPVQDASHQENLGDVERPWP